MSAAGQILAGKISTADLDKAYSVYRKSPEFLAGLFLFKRFFHANSKV